MPIHEVSLIRPENLAVHEHLEIEGIDVSGHWSTFIGSRVVQELVGDELTARRAVQQVKAYAERQAAADERPPAPPPPEQFAAAARAQRNALLTASDWTQLPDAQTGMSAAAKTAWAVYRQALRDVPEQDDFPQEIIWPVAPTP